MELIYNNAYIYGHEAIFYTFLGIMLLIIIFAFIVSIKEILKNVDK